MKEIQTVAIIGSGAMGSGIAQVAAVAGMTVLVYDQRQVAVNHSRDLLRSNIDKLAAKGRLSSEQAEAAFGRLYFTEQLDTVSAADLVIEAIVEDPVIKKDLFGTLDQICSPEAVLATNTSSLSVTSLAAACRRPERVLGLHFFNPAAVMPLVEVIPAVQTDTALISSACHWMAQWGKIPVVARDTPGFIVNRIARPYYGEAIRIYEENLASAEAIDHAMTAIGFRMGPFALMDLIGHDVNYAVTESVFSAFYFDPRYKPSFTQKRLVEAGFLGRKSGRGFYIYHEGEVASPTPSGNLPPEQVKEISDRILALLINEAADALYLGIAGRDDIDTAMTRGVNYPKGLLRWADEWGIGSVVALLDKLQDHYREDRYRCAPLLRIMASQGETFYDTAST